MSLSSYFCSRSYFHSRKTGLLFSILYTACSTISDTLLLNDDIGQTLSFAWEPIILFGFLWVLHDGSHWTMLSLGMTLLVLSHILTTLLMTALIIILGIFSAKRIFTHRHILAGYLKAGITAVASTAIFWMPIIYTIKKNVYFNPKYGSAVKFWMSGMLWCRSGAFIHENCGFIDGIGILVGLYGLYLMFEKHANHYIHIPYTDWCIWAIGMFYWACNADIYPIHHVFATTFLNVFQFSFRSALPLHICFAYLAVKWLAGYYDNYVYGKRRYKRVFISLFIAFALIMQFANQLNDKLIYQQRATYNAPHQMLYGVRMKEITEHHPQGRGWVLDNNSFKHMRNTGVLQDYQPLNTTTNHPNRYSQVGQHFVTLYGRNYENAHHIVLTRNGVRMDISHDLHSSMIPLLWYHGYRYNVTDNGKPVHWTTSKHANFVVVPKLKAGYHLLQEHPKINQNTRHSLIITAVGWILFLLSLLKTGISSKHQQKSAIRKDRKGAMKWLF